MGYTLHSLFVLESRSVPGLPFDSSCSLLLVLSTLVRKSIHVFSKLASVSVLLPVLSSRNRKYVVSSIHIYTIQRRVGYYICDIL